MFKFLQKLLGRNHRFDEPVVVDCDAERLWVRNPAKAEEGLSWSDLEGVAIQTNDSGPFGEDVWWLLGHSKGVLPFPNSATGVQKVMGAMQERLTDFDLQRLIEAQGCAENRTFILWDRNGRHKTAG